MIALQSVASQMPDFTGKVIDDGRFELVRLLGAGGGGVVYLATDHHAPTSSSDASPAQCAIKIVRKLAEPALEYQVREIAIHHLVSDIPHVLPLHDAWDDDEYLYMSLEYCESDLYRSIFERRAYWGNDELVRTVFLQILDAVNGCHQRDIYHRDLKPENILCNAEGTEAYVADFGLATANTWSTTLSCGSLPYLSPESTGDDSKIQAYSTKRSDIWALGVILVNMVTGLCPWAKASSRDRRFREYLRDDTYLERNLPVSRGVVRILKQVFQTRPRLRPRLEQLRESILAVESFFPPLPAGATFGPRAPLPTETDATHAPKAEEIVVEEIEVAGHPADSASSSPCSNDAICLSTTDASDPGTVSTEDSDSVPATPPDDCHAPTDPSDLVQEVDKALRSLTDAPKGAELSILERLDVHAVE